MAKLDLNINLVVEPSKRFKRLLLDLFTPDKLLGPKIIITQASIYNTLFPADGRELVATLKGDIMGFVLKDNQEVDLGPIQPVSVKGNPAAVDGTPTWSSTDETILTVTSLSDGLSATVKAVGPIGNAQIIVSVDADTGEGVKPITQPLDGSVIASDAAGIQVPVGTPRDQA